MRWMWIDKFVAFSAGQSASAIKNVTRAEEHLYDDVPGAPILPPTLMIEGMAQTAGILVGESRGFAENVVLAKIRKASFDDYAGPGDQLRYDAQIESIDERAAIISGAVFKNGMRIGSVELMFSHVDQAEKKIDLPDHNFVFTDQFRDLLAGFDLSRRGEGVTP